jgi:hypothetical protein
MKINYFEMELPPIGFLPRDSLGGVADLVKGLLTRDHVHADKLSYWQIILLQSKANGCMYRGQDLPQTNWEWPKNTWFQERLNRHVENLEFTAQRGSTKTCPRLPEKLISLPQPGLDCDSGEVERARIA